MVSHRACLLSAALHTSFRGLQVLLFGNPGCSFGATYPTYCMLGALLTQITLHGRSLGINSVCVNPLVVSVWRKPLIDPTTVGTGVLVKLHVIRCKFHLSA